MPPSTISPERSLVPRLRHGAVLLFAALMAGLAQAGAPHALQGKVSHVTDGDSVWVRPAHGGKARRIRLVGIDAPEICQPHGLAARDALRRQVIGQQVRVQGRGRDDYDRQLRRIGTAAVPDLGAWMVAQGHAWSYRRRGRAGPYDAQEALARAAQRGLWAQASAIEPRIFRRVHGSCR
jgi:micrococcal nuclease